VGGLPAPGGEERAVGKEKEACLTGQAADCHAEPTMVACKLMRRSWELTDQQRGGLTSRQFIRYGLLRLQLGHHLKGFTCE
jgi:hypothetical protein